VADAISKAAPWAIYGLFLIGFMFVMPAGISGFVDKVGARLQRRLPRAGSRAAQAPPATGSNPQP